MLTFKKQIGEVMNDISEKFDTGTDFESGWLYTSGTGDLTSKRWNPKTDVYQIKVKKGYLKQGVPDAARDKWKTVSKKVWETHFKKAI